MEEPRKRAELQTFAAILRDLQTYNGVERKGLWDYLGPQLRTLWSISHLDKEDRERLRELQTVSDLLRQQGKELQTYWDTGKDENAAKYENLRKNAWTTMTRLMGIGE